MKTGFSLTRMILLGLGVFALCIAALLSSNTSAQSTIIKKTLRARVPSQDMLMNDPAIRANWGLQGTATPQAWRISRGDRKIIVAIIDTGVDTNHPDLKDNLWVNSGETGIDAHGRDRSSNGIDDDQNGFIDDVHGWNFAAKNHDLQDHHGHGTHIAGIIGANGERGLKGVSPLVSMMILKYYDPKVKGFDPLNGTVQAIRYAVKMGANIINYSGGGVNPSQEELAAIKDAETHHILFVAAAGNEHSNSDLHHYFPADYGLSNILSVTAINEDGLVLKSSNWGESTVDIAAPGEDIVSTLPGDGYGAMTGTSQATAFATGVAVLVMAHRPDLRDPRDLIRHLLDTGEPNSGLNGKTRARTTLNSYRALAMKESSAAANGAETENAD
jgi:thermitase